MGSVYNILSVKVNPGGVCFYAYGYIGDLYLGVYIECFFNISDTFILNNLENGTRHWTTMAHYMAKVDHTCCINLIHIAMKWKNVCGIYTCNWNRKFLTAEIFHKFYGKGVVRKKIRCQGLKVPSEKSFIKQGFQWGQFSFLI